MFIVLWLFGPGVLAALYFFRIAKKRLSPVSFAGASIAFSFLIALFITGISFLRGNGSHDWLSMFSSISNLVKYGALSLLAAVAFPNIALLLAKLLDGKKHET